MKSRQSLLACSLLLLSALCIAQQANPQMSPAAVPKPARTAYYVDPEVLTIVDLLPDPPAVDSAASRADLAEVHRIEQARTPEQAAKAKADEDEEDMFVFKSVFGPNFTGEALPITAALGVHVKNEQSVIGAQLKSRFQRPRPYQTDSTLHPACQVETKHDSYPSGHGLTGYLEAFTLAEIVPEKRTEILARADNYAHNRVVCGVHYPSDIEASRQAAYAIFGYMLATPRFQRDLAAAREEMRTKLGLMRTSE
jgi:acid phosphatase (class A)